MPTRLEHRNYSDYQKHNTPYFIFDGRVLLNLTPYLEPPQAASARHLPVFGGASQAATRPLVRWAVSHSVVSYGNIVRERVTVSRNARIMYA